MAHIIFRTLVIETKLIDYQYFMESLEEWEVYMFYDNLRYCERSAWEMNRIIAYILAQSNSKKRLEITDIMSFPWDEDYSEKNTEMSNEDRDKLRAKAAMFEKIL